MSEVIHEYESVFHDLIREKDKKNNFNMFIRDVWMWKSIGSLVWCSIVYINFLLLIFFVRDNIYLKKLGYYNSDICLTFGGKLFINFSFIAMIVLLYLNFKEYSRQSTIVPIQFLLIYEQRLLSFFLFFMIVLLNLFIPTVLLTSLTKDYFWYAMVIGISFIMTFLILNNANYSPFLRPFILNRYETTENNMRAWKRSRLDSILKSYSPPFYNAATVFFLSMFLSLNYSNYDILCSTLFSGFVFLLYFVLDIFIRIWDVILGESTCFLKADDQSLENTFQIGFKNESDIVRLWCYTNLLEVSILDSINDYGDLLNMGNIAATFIDLIEGFCSKLESIYEIKLDILNRYKMYTTVSPKESLIRRIRNYVVLKFKPDIKIISHSKAISDMIFVFELSRYLERTICNAKKDDISKCILRPETKAVNTILTLARTLNQFQKFTFASAGFNRYGGMYKDSSQEIPTPNRIINEMLIVCNNIIKHLHRNYKFVFDRRFITDRNSTYCEQNFIELQ